MISRTILAVAVGLLAGLGLPSAAGACSLAYSTPKDRLRAADVAVYGVVASVRVLDDETQSSGSPSLRGSRFEARVRVSRVYKGTMGPAVRIRGYTSEASCGIGELRRGERLGLLLDRPGRPYQVSLGSRISLADLRQATAGRFTRPGRGAR